MSERADREREVAASEREHAAVCRAIAAFTIEPGERKRLEEQALWHDEAARLHETLGDTYDGRRPTSRLTA